MSLNLKVLHDFVGLYQLGNIVPTTAVEGGLPECDRLVSIGACAWTEAEPNVVVVAARSAVAEMPDDALAKENERLRAELAKRDDSTGTAEEVAKAVAVAKAEADGEISRLKAELEKAKAKR